MKFTPRCKTKKFGIIYTILGSFYSVFNWDGPILGTKSGLGKSLDMVEHALYNTPLQIRVHTQTFYFAISQPKHVLRAQKKRLTETVLLSMQNKGLNG